MKPVNEQALMSSEARRQSFHMDPEEFRKYGHEVIDWIADYYSRVESFPVLSQVNAGDVRASLPDRPPQHGEKIDAILRDLDNLILPGVTHWQSPNFFAYFPSNTSGASLLGDFLSSGLGVQGMLWATSPACTELETLVLDWLVYALALPDKFLSTGRGGGAIQDTASSATLCAMLAARERATHFQSNRTGVVSKLCAYASTQAHSATEKAMGIAGLGRDQLRHIEVGSDFSMNASALAAAMRNDRQTGRIPFFVCATSGTTSSNAIDPLCEIGPICREFDAWLHVDSAMSGTAAICPDSDGKRLPIHSAGNRIKSATRSSNRRRGSGGAWSASKSPALVLIEICRCARDGFCCQRCERRVSLAPTFVSEIR